MTDLATFDLHEGGGLQDLHPQDVDAVLPLEGAVRQVGTRFAADRRVGFSACTTS